MIFFYISYAGTFDIDRQNQHVIHHVELSMFPNNVGHDQESVHINLVVVVWWCIYFETIATFFSDTIWKRERS
jgi:hypothetical protein